MILNVFENFCFSIEVVVSVCVCACVHMGVGVCVCVHACIWVWACVCVNLYAREKIFYMFLVVGVNSKVTANQVHEY